MTAKRFVIKDERTIKDTQKENGYVFCWICGAEEMCNLLNELYEENRQLEMESEEYNEDAMSYQTLYEQQLEKFEELLSECKHQQEQKMKLYKENKKLKQQLKDCEFAYRTEMTHHRVIEKELKEKIAKRDYTSMGLYDD